MRVSIFEFKSYRKFLKAYYEQEKSERKGFSYEAFSRKAGLGSANYFKFVMEGKRNLTNENIHRFATALEFDFLEREYFESLVLYEQASFREEKAFYKKRLHSQIENNEVICKFSKNEIAVKWYYPLVQVLAHGRDCQSSEKFISQSLDLNTNLVRETLSDLVDKKALLIREESYWMPETHSYSHDKKALSNRQKIFIGEQLQLSLLAYRRSYEKSASFLSHSMTVDPSAIQDYYEAIDRFISELTKISDRQMGDSPMQLNLQFFCPRSLT